MIPAQREELWQAHDALAAVGRHLGLTVEQLLEDPAVVLRSRNAVLEVAARLERAADAKAAALVAGGAAASAASTVYELRSFATELRSLAEQATEGEGKP